eukprot:54431_1
MPSLPTKTFTAYYPWNIVNNVSSYQAQNPVKESCKITAQTTLCVVLTFLTVCPFLDWFVANYPDLYEHKYKMYFVYNIFFGVLPIPFAILFFLIVYRNIVRRCTIMLVILLVACLLVSTSCVLSYLYHENIYVGQIISLNSSYCKIVNCNYLSPYWLSITLYPITILIVSWIVLLVVYLQSKKSLTMDTNNPISSQTLINAKANDSSTTAHKIKIICSVGMLFVLWTILFFCAFIPSQNLLNNHFIEVIYFWIVCTHIAKFVCKRICRVIDNIRCLQYDVSAEIITEFYISSLYWIIFRYYTVLYENVTWKSFWFAKLLHIGTEVYQSNVRMSKIYFNIRSKILNCLPDIEINGLISDKQCGYNKNMIRMSIDIIIRSMICVVINIYIGLNIFTQYITGILNKIYGKQYTSTYMSSAMERLCYSIIIEMILYVATYFYFKYHYNFNIYGPFINMYNVCCKSIQFLLIIFAVMNIGQNTSQRNF